MQCQRCGARFTQASVGAAKVSETTTSTKFPWQTGGAGIGGMDNSLMDESAEDNAELLAAIVGTGPYGCLSIAVPIGRRRRYCAGGRKSRAPWVWNTAPRQGSGETDTDLGQPLEIASSGMLRSGRHSKRLLELSAIMYTLRCSTDWSKYERAAFGDRRAALVRRVRARQGGSTCSSIVDAAASNVRLIARTTTTCFWQYEHEQWLSGQQHGSVERD
jgi:hypothetical protein